MNLLNICAYLYCMEIVK
ncbi:hypothetical protein LSH36_61g07012 [Paralvinella palmiformis]|uniref:Uncharacterized protein n=1 Tax=Paralvinella palmiformis TaxID=53620 RepID=A0AAD9K4H5_9ANNE|nr:hypothetical protein LSH36_61g07012 [Paralvinella palmiformis]